MKIIKGKSTNEFLTEEKCYISEILNSEELQGLSIATARVSPGVTTMLHSIKNTNEVYYILSGNGEMEIDGNVAGIAEPGDAVFIPANSTQRITNKTDEDLVFLCICSPRFVVDNYIQNS
jgi:mannose-6-phosphate isomerase-like protein (cupin superfamily)